MLSRAPSCALSLHTIAAHHRRTHRCAPSLHTIHPYMQSPHTAGAYVIPYFCRLKQVRIYDAAAAAVGSRAAEDHFSSGPSLSSCIVNHRHVRV
jgi:hypothetical protein